MSQNLPYNGEVAVPVAGSDRDTWGTLLLNALFLFDRRVGWLFAMDVTSGDITLDDSQAQAMSLVMYGAPAGNRFVLLKVGRARAYVVRNDCSTNLAVAVKVVGASGSGLVIPRGSSMMVYTDGTNVWAASPGVRSGGGFPGQTRDPSNTYWGAGISFEFDANMGFARRTGDTLGVMAGGSTQTDHLRFHAGTDPNYPTVALPDDTSGFTMGLQPQALGVLGFCSQGRVGSRLGNGFWVGNPTNGDPGVGWLAVQNGMMFDTLPIRFAQLIAALANNAVITAPHGLGRVPTSITVGLECLTAQAGYSPGDIVYNFQIVGSSATPFPTVWTDATQVGLVGGGTGWSVRNKSTKADTTLTAASWQVVFTVS